MLILVHAMGLVIASWLAFFALFSGLGLLTLRACGQKPTSGWLILDGFWLGWALAIGLLQFWHFVFPVNDVILLLLALLALTMIYGNRAHLWPVMLRLRLQRGYLLVLALLLLWMSNRALGMPIAFDTGLRDIQAVMWIDSYAVTPGLGNLFPSLAYNHSVYLYDALLDTAMWSGRSYRIATGLLIMVYLAYATKRALSLHRCRKDEELRWSSVVGLLTIPFVLYYTVRWGGITHFLTDTVVELVGFLTLIYLLDFLQDWRPGEGAKNYQIWRLAFLIMAGMTIKQSYAVFGLATALLALLVWIRRGGAAMGGRRVLALGLPVTLLAGAFILPWMARGVITSGYVAYPHSIGRFNVDWALPHEHMQERQRALATNTRQRGAEADQVLATLDWLGPWLEDFATDIFSVTIPSVMALAGLGLYGARRFVFPGRWRGPPLGIWTLTPIIVALLLWFVSFPEIKYARYLFWGLAALSVLLALQSWPKTPLRLRIAAVYLLAALCTVYVVFLIFQHRTGPLTAGVDRGFHLHWQTRYIQFETEQGLTVNMPPHGTQQCWHTPLPCTNRASVNLVERVAGDMSQGFRLESKGPQAGNNG